MSVDLTQLLADWPYEPGELKVRLIQGDDGSPRLQVRVDLGVLQMYLDGRPDGAQPFGFDSLLEYHESKLDGPDADLDAAGSGEDAEDADGLADRPRYRPRRAPTDEEGEGASDADGPNGMAAGSAAGRSDAEDDDAAEAASTAAPDDAESDDDEDDDDEPPTPRPGSLALSPEDCRALREEALQYYHRYIALMVMEDFDGVVRDTTRNLRVLDLLGEHAATESDRGSLEPNRAYIVMMRARAMASQALRDQEPKAAVLAIDQGLDALRAWFAERGEPEGYERSREVQLLQSMREALVPKLPVSQKAELRRRLNEAIMSENYELAAILRDELKMLPGE